MRPIFLASCGLALAWASPAFAESRFTITSDGPCTEGFPCAFLISRPAPASSWARVLFKTADADAKAGTDYTSTTVTVTFANRELVRRVTVPTIGNGVVDGSRDFNAIITPVRNAAIAVGSANGVILDDDVTVTPTPPPSPPPTPPQTGYLASPTLGGLSAIASEFTPSLSYHLTGGTGLIPPSAAPDVVGAFRFICTAGQVKADDPIVYPGQPGASHLHQFYGNTTTDANSTFTNQRAGGTSTCNGGAYAANRSAYWMPAMLNGLGYVVRPDYVAIYYKRRPASDPKCSLTSGDPKAEGNCVAIPNGLRFIFGYDMLTGKAPTGELWFNCDGPTAVPGHYNTLAQAFANCPAGNRLGAVIKAPQCWDGKNLDSPNHRDHVAYEQYGTWGYPRCDAAHSYVIPGFQLSAWYSILPGDDTSKWSLSSDAMHPDLPKGTTFHADYFEAWDPAVKAMWTANCIDKMLNCSAGVLGEGHTLNNAAVQGNANPRLVPVP